MKGRRHLTQTRTPPLALQTEDGLTHLQWLERGTAAADLPELDTVIFPQEASFGRVGQQRAFVLKFAEDKSRNQFFWAQEPDASGDEALRWAATQLFFASYAECFSFTHRRSLLIQHRHGLCGVGFCQEGRMMFLALADVVGCKIWHSLRIRTFSSLITSCVR